MLDITFEIPSTSNITTAKGLDLTGLPYHGGSTLSSGALPKWDLLEKKYMVKRATFDEFGDKLTDCANEVLVYRFCKKIGVSCAEYFPTVIKYRDADTDEVIVSPAAVTKIFNGLVHYRDARESLGIGKNADELLEIHQKFDVKTELNDMLAIDFIFGQQDRHSKNIGIVGNGLSPMFDSGACLYFDAREELLGAVDATKIQNHKTFAKPYSELIAFSLNYICKDFAFLQNAAYLKTEFEDVLENLKHQYSPIRFEFIKKFVHSRIDMFTQITRKR